MCDKSLETRKGFSPSFSFREGTPESEFERTIRAVFSREIDVQFVVNAFLQYKINKLQERLDTKDYTGE